MRKKKRNNEFDSYEEDIINIPSKEDEIIESYLDDYDEEYLDETQEELPPKKKKNQKSQKEDIIITDNIEDNYDNYEDYYEENNYEDPVADIKRKNKRVRRTINIVFTVIIIVLIAIATDVICVARYNVGPFFAIPVHKYNDGGTKEYYGFGYKVIKYNQVQGRKDKEIGLWSLKYNIDPITFQDIDLAIEIKSNETATYKKYYKKFVRIISTLEKIDKENNKIVIGYQDEDGKYTLEIECDMATEREVLDNFEEQKEITIIGSITDFKYSTEKKPNRLYISNCFAEQ